MTAAIALAAAALVSWLLGVALITLLPAGRLPMPAQRALSHAGPAVLAGLLATAVAQGAGVRALVTPSPRLAAVAIGVLVAARTRSMPLTVGATVGAVWLLELVWR